jgi:hypothetical protein
MRYLKINIHEQNYDNFALQSADRNGWSFDMNWKTKKFHLAKPTTELKLKAVDRKCMSTETVKNKVFVYLNTTTSTSGTLPVTTGSYGCAMQQ